MKKARELEQGYYLELNLSWDQKQREMERMAETCGVEVSTQEWELSNQLVIKSE
jgi:hypothetical protein